MDMLEKLSKEAPEEIICVAVKVGNDWQEIENYEINEGNTILKYLGITDNVLLL